MSETAPIIGVVVCHGDMATGMVDAVQRITGSAEGALVPLSNQECAPDTLAGLIDEAVGGRPAIVFTDLQAGSCGFAARRLCLGRSDLWVVSGVNLPLLVDFVMHRDMPPEELVPRLLEKGRAGIAATEPATPGDHARRAVSRG